MEEGDKKAELIPLSARSSYSLWSSGKVSAEKWKQNEVINSIGITARPQQTHGAGGVIVVALTYSEHRCNIKDLSGIEGHASAIELTAATLAEHSAFSACKRALFRLHFD
jgi:hypothetical protein